MAARIERAPKLGRPKCVRLALLRWSIARPDLPAPPLPRVGSGRAALEDDFREQLVSIEHEAGVREQL